MARPTDYTPELGAEICRRIGEGRSLRKVCQDEDMPAKTTVMRWLCDRDKGSFRDQYALAREDQADVLFDEAIEIADDGSQDYTTKQIGEGADAVSVEVVDHEHIQRSKLRVDTRKWAAGRLAPKKYGERVAVTGHDGGAIKMENSTVSATPSQIRDELHAIFGDLVPRAPAAKPAGVDRVVHKGAHRSRGQKPRAPAPSKAVAGKE